MYLTKEELIILQGLKENLSYAEISKRLSEPLRTCDSRINSLYQKYGVDNKLDLAQRANLDKVEVARIENIPYWHFCYYYHHCKRVITGLNHQVNPCNICGFVITKACFVRNIFTVSRSSYYIVRA